VAAGMATPEDLSAMSAAARKRYKNEQRRKKRKAQQQEQKEAKKKEAEKKKAEAEKKAEEKEEKGKKKDNKAKPKKVDKDPDGKMLACIADPLAEAAKVVAIVQTHCPKALGTNCMAFDVAMRRKKYLLALRALSRMAAENFTSAEVVCRNARFLDSVASPEVTATLHPTVLRVIQSQSQDLFGTQSAAEYSKNCEARTHAQLVAVSEFVGNDQNAGQRLVDALREDGKIEQVTVRSCLQAQQLIAKVAPKLLETHRAAAQALFPRAQGLKVAGSSNATAVASGDAKPPTPPNA